MIWLGIFVVLGGATVALSRFLTPLLLVSIALGVLASQVLVAVAWVNRQAGIDRLIEDVVLGIGGDGWDHAPASCSSGSILTIVFALLFLLLALTNGLLYWIAMIALPVGAVLSALGGLAALFPRSGPGLLIAGLATMTVGAGAVVLTGIVLAILSGGPLCV